MRQRLRAAELARQQNRADGARDFDPLADCTPPQRAFLLDKSEQRDICATRRSGKTSGIVRDATAESWANPNACVIYLNETRDRAQRTFWEELKNYVAANRLPYKANESKLYLHGPDNRWIWVGGGETKKHIKRWKGTLPKAAAFYVDEAQDWDPEVLSYAYSEVIAPALADMGGRLTISGVPGPIPDPNDFWYSITQNAEFSHHGTDERPFTMWNNPHIKDAQKLLERVMRTRQVDVTDPTIQREFFGRWVRDTAILVFGALDDDANAYDAMPDGNYLFAVGGDGGYVDEASIATLAWMPVDAASKVYVKDSTLFGHKGATEVIQRFVDACAPLSVGGRLVGSFVDPAAGMKNIAHDVWFKYGIELIPADKDDKVGGCKLLASSIASRELLIPRGHKLFRSLRRVQWDPDHRGEKLKGHTPDDVDALLYGYRGAYPWILQRTPPPPKPYEEERLERMLAKQGGQGDIDA